jgi:TetR/AcrR family transcriptional repressor of mexJK operon
MSMMSKPITPGTDAINSPTDVSSPTGRASVASERSARKHRAVTEAATTLFLQHGYSGTSIDQIAALAGVSKPTVYRFFADKEQLLTEIVLDTLDRRGEPFRAELAEFAQTDNLSAELHALARDYITVVTQPAGLALRRLIIGASHQLPELAQAYYERAQDRTLTALAEAFAQLADRGQLEIDDPRSAAAHFAFLVIGRVLDRSLFCPDSPLSKTELKREADAGVTAFVKAYSRRA